jgi:methyl-accepting chemotaxis protein
VNKAVMAMDDTTQQNAALVEQLTSASQSMREQAKELMQLMGKFTLNGKERNTVSNTPVPVPSVRQKPRSGAQGSNRGTPALAPDHAEGPVGVAADGPSNLQANRPVHHPRPINSRNRRATESEFEEF